MNIDFTWKLAYEGKPMFTASKAQPKPDQKDFRVFRVFRCSIKISAISAISAGHKKTVRSVESV